MQKNVPVLLRVYSPICLPWTSPRINKVNPGHAQSLLLSSSLIVSREF